MGYSGRTYVTLNGSNYYISRVRVSGNTVNMSGADGIFTTTASTVTLYRDGLVNSSVTLTSGTMKSIYMTPSGKLADYNSINTLFGTKLTGATSDSKYEVLTKPRITSQTSVLTINEGGTSSPYKMPRLAGVTDKNVVYTISTRYSATTTSVSEICKDTTNVAYMYIDGNYLPANTGYTFSSTGLKYITYYFNKATIPDYFFQSTNLVAISAMNSNFTVMSSGMCDSCQYLTAATVSSSVVTFSQSCFSNCPKLTSIYIPYSTTSILEGAFSNSRLSNITVNSNDGCKIATSAFQSCSGMTTAYLYGASDIAARAFYECTNLQTIIFGVRLHSIGAAAFANCPNVMEITFNSLTGLARSNSNSTYQNVNSLSGYENSGYISAGAWGSNMYNGNYVTNCGQNRYSSGTNRFYYPNGGTMYSKSAENGVYPLYIAGSSSYDSRLRTYSKYYCGFTGIEESSDYSYGYATSADDISIDDSAV